ncbi:unnamed protein product [Danaus chrysippus]|uniref:(African queen) hypothetical protein n=1 Tax=Danaus chrysippus TaxID=151541 RepID=A0A8J2R821_9NEOP|nr:unnamed protein product [Danaus chrysippus]
MAMGVYLSYVRYVVHKSYRSSENEVCNYRVSSCLEENNPVVYKKKKTCPTACFTIAKNEGNRCFTRTGLPAMLGFQFFLNTFRSFSVVWGPQIPRGARSVAAHRWVSFSFAKEWLRDKGFFQSPLVLSFMGANFRRAS